MMNGSPEKQELWTVEECAAWLRITPEALRCRLKRDQIPRDVYVHLGRSVRFVAERVRIWLLRQVA